ncbi:MAG: nitrous oxide-stimulated promoter family protein [Wolinella sp.]
MTSEKFLKDVHILADFMVCYCDGNHREESKKEVVLPLAYKGEEFGETIRIELCNECSRMFLYAHERLQGCPHVEKPSCRKCPHPCYEKEQWKIMAKMMRYSGMRLGFSRLKDKLLKKFT